jgi:uncharacterized repeat protein (TIGR03803 family)
VSAILIAACEFLTTATPAFAANTEQVLYSFTDGTDGAYPEAPLVFDGNGNLYGATPIGGAYGYGTVFELSPANGGWIETTLHSFNGTDGYGPSGLVFDGSGNLYGTTQDGGSGTACSGRCGTVFELSPAGGGAWTYTILYNFKGGNDGFYPFAGVILDAQGNLYGTTSAGGAADRGTAFELTSGTWTKTILHSFHVNTKDGSGPQAALVFDGNGNLYGTTGRGGAGGVCRGGGGCGTVFRLAPNGKGGWTESVLHSFSNKGVSRPDCALVLDAAGNLYGTTTDSYHGYGAVFELTASQSGTWKATILHKFTTIKGGTEPSAGLVFDSQGNLYGATGGGGQGCGVGVGCGLVFEMSPGTTKWTETTVFAFNDTDGALPGASLIFDSQGDLYGTTFYGGSGSCSNDGITGCGTVFEITP